MGKRIDFRLYRGVPLNRMLNLRVMGGALDLSLREEQAIGFAKFIIQKRYCERTLNPRIFIDRAGNALFLYTTEEGAAITKKINGATLALFDGQGRYKGGLIGRMQLNDSIGGLIDALEERNLNPKKFKLKWD